jgi:hypothetical protein
MNAEMLRSKFARMGARLRLHELTRVTGHRGDQPLTLDVRSDGDSEFFDIRVRDGAEVDLEVRDLRRRERHLLLEARDRQGRHLYLCGHDERHWFVAAVPERVGGVTSVFGAMEALKPPEVLEAQRRQGINTRMRRARKNAAYVRQGEWFFLPVPKLHVEKKFVLCNEPLSRGVGSKPHWAEFLYRKGGETVYVCDQHPAGLRTAQYLSLLQQRPRAKGWNWRTMQRDPDAYVKGKISHPDHKTILLQCWHKVLMNTEGQSQAMRHVVFLD